MTDQHDYKAALEWIDDLFLELQSQYEKYGGKDKGLPKNALLVRRALLIADKLQQEPIKYSTIIQAISDEMTRQEESGGIDDPVDLLNALRDQLYKEVDQELGV